MKRSRKTRKCPECGGEVLPGNTELIYELQSRVRITNAPAKICSKCGEVFIPARVAAEANRLVNWIISCGVAG